MGRSTTSSYRLDAQTMAELGDVARRLGKGKNAIIAEAVQDYLRKVRATELAGEARRQSMVASQVVTDDEAYWEEQFDGRGWK